MTDREKIIDRVVKMLALAASTTSPHEAGLAAERAGKLIDDYEIDEAELRVLEPNRRNEPIEKRMRVEGTASRKRITWVSTLAWAVTERFKCHWYYTGGGTVTLFGRQSACQAASYTLEYLYREVNRLADAARADSMERSVRSWKNSFRMGAASAIARRMRELTPTERPAGPGTAHVGRKMHEAGVPEDHSPESRSQALVLLKADHAEVDAAYEKFAEETWGKRRSSGWSNGGNIITSGYSAGQSAGNRVSLGGARASLGRGPGRLA